MASDPYNSGIQTVTPDVQAPNDYQHVDATPNSFGASIATGMQQLGQGAVKYGQFWGEVQGDSVMNNFLKDGNEKMEHFKSLQEQDALDAQKTIADDIQKSAASYREQLQTPDQQKRFDEQTRPYIDRYWAGQITSHGVQQAHSFGTTTNTNAFMEAANRALKPEIYSNEDELKHAYGDAQQFAHKQLVLDGQDRDQASIAAANLRASQAVYGGAALSMSANGHPADALEFIKKHQAELGPDYAKLEGHLRNHAETQSGTAFGASEYAKAKAAATTAAPEAQQTPAQSSFGPAPGANGHGTINAPYTAPLDKPGEGGALTPRMAYGFAKAAGATDNEALMLTGAAASESSFNANAVHDGGVGHGLFGHNDGRLDMRGKSAGEQFQLALQELRSRPESALVNAAKTPEELAIAQMHFEQPRGYTRANPTGGENYTGRLNTLRYFSQLTGTPAFTGPGGNVVPGGGQAMTMPAGATGAPAAQGGAQNGNGLPPVDQAPDPPPPVPASTTPAVQEPPSPEAIRAAAYKAIDESKDKTDAEKQHARIEIDRQAAREAIENEATAKAKKEHQEKQYDHYITQIGLGKAGPEIVDQIYSDPALAGNGEMKYRLANIAKAELGLKDEKGLGANYEKLFQRILPSAPDRIVDAETLVREVNDGTLSTKGYDRLRTFQAALKKDIKTQGVLETFASMKKYVHDQVSFDGEFSIPGLPAKKDQDGEDFYHGKLLGRLEAEFDRRTESAKNPQDIYDWLSKENMDKLIADTPGRRSKAKMELDRVNAGKEATPKDLPAPAAPAGVDAKAWDLVIKTPPISDAGNPWPATNWAMSINALRESPTPEMVAAFNSRFSAKGYTAEDVLKRLPPSASAPSIPEAMLADKPAINSPQPATSAVEPERIDVGYGAARLATATPRAVGGALASAVATQAQAPLLHKLHEWLLGDPQKIIDDVKSGGQRGEFHLLDPGSAMGRAIIAEQERRLAERQKEKERK